MPPNLTAVPMHTQRDIRLDAIRGFLLILMTIDHLPGVLRKYCLEFSGYVSGAEGFVFLSGFVAGLLYTRVSFEEGGSKMWRRALIRFRTIYLYHLGTFILVLAFVCSFGQAVVYRGSWEPILHINLLAAVFLGASFIFQPIFVDILPMYCIFVLAIPLLIKQLRAGNKGLVIGCSFSLWFFSQFGFVDSIEKAFSPKFPVLLGSFDIFAWQLLFIVGVYFGFKRYIRKEEWKRSKLLLCYSAFVAVFFFFLRHEILVNDAVFPGLVALTEKKHLGIARLLNVGAVFYLAACLQQNLKPGFILNSLAYLGRYSLQVFTFHIILVCYLYSFLQRAAGWNTGLSLGLSVLCVGSLFLPACLFDAQKRYRKQENQI